MARTAKVVRELKDLKFKNRHVSRCNRCSRPRSYIRQFGLCRICFRQMALKGELPGVRKASW